MLLRVSGQSDGADYDVQAVNGIDPEDCGIEHAAELVAFAEAVLGPSDEERSRTRAALAVCAGEDGLVDAAAIVAASGV